MAQQAVSAASSENSTHSFENFIKCKTVLQIRWKIGEFSWTTYKKESLYKPSWIRTEAAEKPSWDLADFWLENQKEKEPNL